MRVLITRPAAQAQTLTEALERRGFETIVSPVIEPQASVYDALPQGCDAVLATSANAFRFLAVEDARSLIDLPLFVVGARTARSAVDAGFEAVETVAADARSLLQDLSVRFEGPSSFLYLCGRDRKPALEEELQRAGHRIEVCVVYRVETVSALTDACRAALESSSVDAVLHFSRRSAQAFARLAVAANVVVGARSAVHVCISGDAAQGLAKLGQIRKCVVEKPDAAAMLAALDSLRLQRPDAP